MAKYSIEDTTLNGIADAIREKTGDTATLTPLAMPAAIAGIVAGGGSGGFGVNATAYYLGGEFYAPGSPRFYVPVDVSNGTELKFKYDIAVTTNYYKPKVTIKVHKGATIQEDTNNPKWKVVNVDDNPVTETICSAIQTTLTGVEATVDVSDYTSAAFEVYISSPSGLSAGTAYYSRTKIYDVEVS